MIRPTSAILLAIVSAVLILLGRINNDQWWGIFVFIAGIVVLAVAGAIAFAANRRR